MFIVIFLVYIGRRLTKEESEDEKTGCISSFAGYAQLSSTSTRTGHTIRNAHSRTKAILCYEIGLLIANFKGLKSSTMPLSYKILIDMN